MKRARANIGEYDYDLKKDNCEHFVNWCRYDVSASEQVKKFDCKAFIEHFMVFDIFVFTLSKMHLIFAGQTFRETLGARRPE